MDAYNPCLPGMTLFGLPHALLGGPPPASLTDARLWFCVAFAACMYATTRPRTTGKIHRSGSTRATALLLSFPAVALPLAVGGVDLPVIGLMCLGLAPTGRVGSAPGAGVAAGWRWAPQRA
jgi:hypothetical protein